MNNILIFNKFKILFIFITISSSFINKKLKNALMQLLFKKECNFPSSFPLKELFLHNINFNNNSILIIEHFLFHYECTPGFTKYFIDLGYNVDIIMNKYGISSMCYFSPISKVRIFEYETMDDIIKNIDFFIPILNLYNYILIETVEPVIFDLFKKLHLFNMNNSIFVFHHFDYIYKLSFTTLLKNTQIWCLGNFSIGFQVNPHYFGNIKSKEKNNITRFFITSTVNRTYDFIISAVKKLKNEGLKFHISVVGKTLAFSRKQIPFTLKNYFTFKYNLPYSKLYKEVYKSDFIIINLEPNNINDIAFKKTRVTGSAQLSYGFLKPVLINENFANFYNFNSENSFIYKSSNFCNVMKNAINIKQTGYNEMKEKLLLLSNMIYNISLHNMKTSLEMK